MDHIPVRNLLEVICMLLQKVTGPIWRDLKKREEDGRRSLNAMIERTIYGHKGLQENRRGSGTERWNWLFREKRWAEPSRPPAEKSLRYLGIRMVSPLASRGNQVPRRPKLSGLAFEWMISPNHHPWLSQRSLKVSRVISTTRSLPRPGEFLRQLRCHQAVQG